MRSQLVASVLVSVLTRWALQVLMVQRCLKPLGQTALELLPVWAVEWVLMVLAQTVLLRKVPLQKVLPQMGLEQQESVRFVGLPAFGVPFDATRASAR